MIAAEALLRVRTMRGWLTIGRFVLTVGDHAEPVPNLRRPMSSVLPRHTAVSIAVAAVCFLSVTACGNSGTDAPPAAAPTAAATTAGQSSTPAGDGTAVPAADLCAFLEKNLPRWKSAGGELAAMTQVTTEMFSFYDDQGQPVPRTDLDDLTKAECPDTRTEVLKTIGFDSFLEL